MGLSWLKARVANSYRSIKTSAMTLITKVSQLITGRWSVHRRVVTSIRYIKEIRIGVMLHTIFRLR